jgi:hypothetical protein
MEGENGHPIDTENILYVLMRQRKVMLEKLIDGIFGYLDTNINGFLNTNAANINNPSMRL